MERLRVNDRMQRRLPAVVRGREGEEREFMEATGDEGIACFDDFAASVSEPLMRLAFARTGSVSDAEDLVQDALIDAHRRWDVIGRYDDPSTWARRAVLNRSVSLWRRRGRKRDAVARLASRPMASGGEMVLSDEALWTAIRSLSTRQRSVVLLLWFEDLSVGEVAAVFGCGDETVRTHWRRARTKLAEPLLRLASHFGLGTGGCRRARRCSPRH